MTIKVTVDISAVEFRRLNSFEWAILTLLKTFTKDVPTIPELSSQLAIGEPMFLVAALDALHQVHAVVPRSAAGGLMEIKDFEITELGLQVLKEEGWESDHGETFTETIPFDWPTLKISSHRGGDHHGAKKQNHPSPDEVQSHLTESILESWLNHSESKHCWRVKSFTVYSVEG